MLGHRSLWQLGRGLAAWLLAAGETVWEIDSPKRPSRRMGKKTDDIDASRAGREALGRGALAVPRGVGKRDALAALFVARRSSIQMTIDTERQLHALASTCPEKLAARLRGLKTHRIVSLCNRWRPNGNDAVPAIAETTRHLDRRVRYLNREAKLHEQRITELVRGDLIFPISLASGLLLPPQSWLCGRTQEEFAVKPPSPR